MIILFWYLSSKWFKDYLIISIMNSYFCKQVTADKIFVCVTDNIKYRIKILATNHLKQRKQCVVQWHIDINEYHWRSKVWLAKLLISWFVALCLTKISFAWWKGFLSASLYKKNIYVLSTYLFVLQFPDFWFCKIFPAIPYGKHWS